MDGENATPAVPNDADLKKARADKARADNLEKARVARAENRKKSKASEPESDGASVAFDSPARKDPSGALLAGCRGMVRLCWMLARLGAFLAGGTLAPLGDGDIEEGAREAEPLVRRWAFLATVLTFLGFPLWLARCAAEKFASKSAVPGQEAAPQSVPATSNVVAIGGNPRP